MKRITHTCLALGLLFIAVELSAQVKPRSERTEVIKGVQERLDSLDQTREVTHWEEMRYPFAFPYVAPEPTIAQPTTTAQPAARPEQNRPPAIVVRPEELLERLSTSINRQFRGVVRKDGRPLLFLTNNRRLEEGQRFNVTAEDQRSYLIVLQSISEEAYVLQLDETSLSVSLKEDSSSGSIRLYQDNAAPQDSTPDAL